MLRPGFFPMQDDLQAFRVHQMVKCLQDFQIPCRWIPDMGYQYGYPQFNFYPPSIYYFAAILNVVGVQVIDTVKILFVLGFVLSALAMFIFLNAFLSRFAAFVGAVLYTFAPYKAAEVYVRGSLSEFWAFVFFPLIFWSSYQLIKLGKIRYLGYLSASIALLLITHNLMSFIFLPLFGLWAIVLSLLYQKKNFLKIVIATILGLGLAAFFTAPVIFEGKFVHLETLTGGYFDFRQHFVNLRQLFLSNHFGYGSSYLGSNDDLSLSVGFIHWMLAAVSLIIALLNFKKDKKLSYIIFTLVSFLLLVLFLMHQRSSFIWDAFSPLTWLQFPWRFLSDSTFLLSTLGGICIYQLSQLNQRFGKAMGVLTIVLVIILHGSFFAPKEWLYISDTEKFSGTSWEKQLTISIFDYLPIYAKLPPNKKAPELPETLEGQVEFKNYVKGSDFQKGEIEVKEKAILRIPLFDFPGMQVMVDGKKVNHWHDDCRYQEYCLGLITFDVGEGIHKFEARLNDTPVRSISNLVTIISIGVLIYVFYLSKKDEKVF